MKPAFSILHATYGRPEKAVAAMLMALERSATPTAIEYIFACNANDPSLPDFVKLIAKNAIYPGVKFSAIYGNFIGSAPAWNGAANESSGEILVQMQDDLELPEKWDALLSGKLAGVDQKKPVFIAVSDGFRTDGICCTAIMNRARYVQQGEFLHPGYMSVFSDDDVTYRALRDARDGKCTFVNARDLTFLHRHHYHDKSVPMDATYERENSSEAYAAGGELFAKRNPEASTDGIRTWG